MKARQRRIYSFDSRSALLFAALAIGGAGAMQAQAQTPSPQFGPAAKPASQTESTFSSGPGTTAAPSQSTAAATAAASAFERADTNKDGKLSEKEAAMFPAIAQRFKELDTDKDGVLSPTEFEKGAHF